MWNTILGVAFTLFMAAFCAASCWLSWQKARARSGKPRNSDKGLDDKVDYFVEACAREARKQVLSRKDEV